MNPKFNELLTRIHEISDLRAANAVLHWDQETYMPVGGAKGRASVLASISRLAHKKFTDPDMGKLLEELSAETEQMPYHSFEASLIRALKDDYHWRTKVPLELVAELSGAKGEAKVIWRKAREENNFEQFAPILERMISLTRQFSDCFSPYEHVYDPLLDRAEKGLTTKDMLGLFSELKKEIVPLIKAISEKKDAVDDSVLHQPYDEKKQWEFGLEVIKAFGYDMSRGRQDISAHPFTSGLGVGDVRITTRINPNFLSEGLFATMHENGHGLYNLGYDASLARTPLYSGVSGGFQESQSRMWENIVGRSREFWTYWFSRLQSYFPAQLKDCDMESFYRAVNKVMPSLIRVEADEVTYNLHIMLRCELEIEMLEGNLAIKDVPDAWNAKFEEYLGLVPPSDKLGCLQDIHWASGFIGAFTVYLMGNLYGAQMFETAMQEIPDLKQQFANGQYLNLLNWYRKNLHCHGRKFTPKEMIQRITKKPLSTTAWVSYAKKKFGDIYSL